MSKKNGCPAGRIKIGNSCYDEDSWISKLNVAYDSLTSTGDNKVIDKANNIITNALGKLDALGLEGHAFIVNSKDIFDKKKNPNLSLSPRDIARNPKIPKRRFK